MRFSAQTTIGAVVTTLRREIDERKTLLAMLEAITATGASAPAETIRRRRNRSPIVVASLEILRDAGRPMHGLTELLPALEARGLKLAHPASLATALMRSGEVDRPSPGTFAAKGGAAGAP